MRWERYLRNLYRNVKKGGSYQSAEKLYETVKREGRFNISLAKIKKWLEGEDTYTLNKEVRRNFVTNQMGITELDCIWEADLADLSKYASYNDGVHYMLGCIDSFSRHLWIRPLKTKHGSEIVKALTDIFKQDSRHPRTIRTDRGSEFTNATVSKFLKENKIGQSFTSNQSQAAFIERCWKSVKKRMTKYFQDRGTFRYIDMLQNLVVGYNSTIHSSLGMAPKDVSKENELEVEYNQMEARRKRSGKKAVSPNQQPKSVVFKFKIGTPVRLSLRPEKITSEYVQKWSTEIFFIHSRRERDGIPVYKVKDGEGEVLFGSFYTGELQRVSLPKKDKMYDIDKIVRERVTFNKKGKKKKEYLVSFRGYPSKFNQWIPENQVKRKHVK